MIFATVLNFGLLLPLVSKEAEIPKTTTSELSNVRQKKKKSKIRKSTAKKVASKECTNNGHPITVGSRGGSYYYSGKSKEYLDCSYCASCN